MDREKGRKQMEEALGRKPLSRTWAKAEILLGLIAAGVGILLGNWAVGQTPEPSLLMATAGLSLFVLGGYLALAGHRSHLYQSSNEVAVYLAQEIRSQKDPFPGNGTR